MSDIEMLKQIGTVRKFSAGEYVCREGDSGSEMYIIIAGKVDVYINSSEGLPIKVSEIAQGSFFGEMSLLEDLPRSASVVAAQETYTLTINRSNIEVFIRSQPGMAYKVMKGLSSRIRNLNNEIKSLKKGDNEILNRTANTLSNSSKTNTTINAVNNGKLRDMLIPLNHKSYNITAPDTYNQYLFDKEIQCPVCSKPFKVRMQRLSKLKLNKVLNDFRKLYHEFEPLWYSLWICPNCFYTNFYNDFESITNTQIKQMKDKLPDLKELYAPQFSGIRNIDQVFIEFYMAMYCAKQYNANSLKFGKIWLQLSWLYKDAEDDVMFKEAASIALNNYHNALYKEQMNLSDEQEQQLYLILGELYSIKGEIEEARKHFYGAIKRKGGSANLNQQAQDRIHDLKTN